MSRRMSPLLDATHARHTPHHAPVCDTPREAVKNRERFAARRLTPRQIARRMILTR
jgi:hypothetical protein